MPLFLGWYVAIGQARQRLNDDPGDFVTRMHLANVLHMSGNLSAAQVIYEKLLVATGGSIILDPGTTSIMATARMAYGRLAAGNVTGANEVLEIVSKDIRARASAGIRESYMLRAAAMVAAIQGDRESLIDNIGAAIDAGLRDNFLLREPAMGPYSEDPRFQALADRLDSILREERNKTLQLICGENPAAKVWQPLPDTCEGVTG